MFVETKKEGEISLEPWRDLLLRAADEMERRGNAKCITEDREGRVCFWGAVNVAHHGSPQHVEGVLKHYPYRFPPELDEVARRFCAHIGGQPWRPHESCAEWSNAAWRTGGEIVAAMRACALTKAV